MDPVLSGAAAILAMLALMAVGVPVAFGMGLVGLGGLWLVGGERLTAATMKTLPYNVSAEYAFVVIPMFILMGALTSASGVTTDLYTAFYRLFSRIRGSLYMVTTVSSAGFAAISGSTMVNAIVFTKLALPQMIRFGYDRAIGAGCIAAAGTFAAMIPPSIMMVVYALLSGESLGKLLIAGIVPGVLCAAIYVAAIAVFVRIWPSWAPPPVEGFSAREKLESLRRVGPFALLALVVIGGIYTGAMFPSSAGAVGAVGAWLIALARRRAPPAAVYRCLRETAITTTVLFLLIVAGILFSRYLVFVGFIDGIVGAIEGSGLGRWEVMLLIVVMYLILGMFMDTLSMTVVTVPFVHPIVVSLGFDPIWFGVILIKLIELGAITPPVGLNLYAVLGSAEGQITTGELFRGVVPFIGVELLVLALLLAFPEISLWLPSRMVG